MKYDPMLIEKKWQDFWKKNKSFRATQNDQRKYYVLDMFPYPSGSGLHIGHLIGYTATDVMARYHWHLGDSVLHPMGWDSFGLPAEQYAIKTGTHPAITTQQNIAHFKKQLCSIGYAYDWDREIATSDPDYYRWTQYLFIQLYEKGLAYQAKMFVNYCPALNCVLANEEVEGGFSKEGGYPIERRSLKQWILKITAYADRLLEDLETLDWPEGLKKLQRHWIGKSNGVVIQFTYGEHLLPVFTTRPDTLFGVSYIVLSPEHPLVDEMTSPEQKEAVHAYLERVKQKSDLERTELTEKSGVFSGSEAICPLRGIRIPIWIADYVLMSYGTGSVMGVPAHDERDFAFAKKYHLPIIKVIDTPEACYSHKSGTLIQSRCSSISLDGLPVEQAIETITRYIEDHGIGYKKTQYRLRDWLFSRQRYWGEPIPILHFEDGSMRPLDSDELPLLPPDLTDFQPSVEGESPLAKLHEWVEIFDVKTKQPARRETDTMPQWAGSCWYYLRFCDPHNRQAPWDKKIEKHWLPVDLYVGGAEHAVLHLLYARFWHKVFYDLTLVSTKEPFQKLCNQGLVMAKSYRKRSGLYVSPEHVIEHDGQCFDPQGEPLIVQIEKMSKSKLNGIPPDDIVMEYGADALRLYTLFMGPIEKEKIWNTQGVAGCRRFLQRFFDMVTSSQLQDKDYPEAEKAVHKLIQGVTGDLENMLFNTCIAKMMEFLNTMQHFPIYPKHVMQRAVILLSPFAPHLAEELWVILGGKAGITTQPWPHYDSRLLEEETICYVIQVNGRLRGQLHAKKGLLQEEVLRLAQQQPSIERYITEISKLIFVPNKLLNIVVKT